MQTQTGNTSRPITANISGLSASHLYHFRIVATNGGGTSFGADRTFTTLSAPPVVTSNPATNVASVSATLNGSVNPRGSTTTVYFQWGTTTSYGHTTPVQTQTGNTSLPITANISGLSASHLYHFRIVATNGGGTSFGPDRTFTTLSATGAPVVTTNPATNVTIFFSETQWLTRSAWVDDDCLFQVGHDNQLRAHHPCADSDWEYVPEHHCEHQRLN